MDRGLGQPGRPAELSHGQSVRRSRFDSAPRAWTSASRSTQVWPANHKDVLTHEVHVVASCRVRKPDAAQGFSHWTRGRPHQVSPFCLDRARRNVTIDGTGSRTRPRKCPACRGALPRDAHPRRRYCSPACVAHAYRARKRSATVFERMRAVGLGGMTGEKPEAGIVCPGCGGRIYPGGRLLRADARHCSARCRQRDYRRRQREKVLDHDAQPSPGDA